MRLLISIAGAWICGVLVEGVVGGSPWIWAVAILVALVVATRRRPIAAAILIALLGGAFASSWQRVRAAHGPAGWSERVALEGTLARPVEDLEGGGRLALIDLDVGARVAVTDSGSAELLPGDRVRFVGAPRPPRGYADEGAFDRTRLDLGRGIDLVASAARPGIVQVDAPERWNVWRPAAILQRAAGRAVARAARGDGEALLEALVLGRRGEIPQSLEDDYRHAGVSHVLSVSGLHLAAVCLLLFELVRRLSLRLAPDRSAERIAALVAAPAAVLYTMLTGAEVATVRALLCALLWLGGRALGRRTDALTALAAAALLILVESPWAVYDVSFQLSFTATAALAVFAERRRGAGPPVWWRRVLGLIEASAVAFVATAPLTALNFGVLQPAGIVTNLIVVPLAELVVLPLGLAGALVATVWPAVGGPIVKLAALVAHVLDLIVHFAATHLPTFEVPPPRPVELVAFAVAFLLIAFRRRARWVALALVVAAGSCATSYLPARGVTVTFLDVGQGDSAVIQTPHETILVDAGGRLFGSPGDDERTDPGEQAVARFLAARRIRKIDLVIISHPHPDHYGGLAAVAKHVPIGEIWTSGDDPKHLPRAATHVGHGATWRADGASLTVVSPEPDEARGQNDNSLVVRFEYAGRSILFSGDLEAPGEEATLSTLERVDIVKVPHHGSRTSSSPPFIAATSPRYAVISCGVANKFHFPADEVVARWTAAGAKVLRTDRDGAITARISPDGALSVGAYLH